MCSLSFINCLCLPEGLYTAILQHMFSVVLSALNTLKKTGLIRCTQKTQPMCCLSTV